MSRDGKEEVMQRTIIILSTCSFFFSYFVFSLSYYLGRISSMTYFPDNRERAFLHALLVHA